MSGLNGLVKGCLWCCAALALCCGLLLSSGCGCNKKKAPPLPEVYTYRANDTNYFNALHLERQKQMAAEMARYETTQKMTQLVARVRAAYPQGVSEEVLQAALAANAEWRDLEAREIEQKEFAKQVRDGSFDVVRSRILEEQQAQKDVKAGKAKAVDKPRERPAGWPKE